MSTLHRIYLDGFSCWTLSGFDVVRPTTFSINSFVGPDSKFDEISSVRWTHSRLLRYPRRRAQLRFISNDEKLYFRRFLGMNLGSFISRLQKVNNQVMTISSLLSIQDMSEKRGKRCCCKHHLPTSISRSTGKCNESREKKKSRCSCRPRPKICTCPRTPDDEAKTNRKSKESEIEVSLSRRSDESPHRERPIEILRHDIYHENEYSIVKLHENPREVTRDRTRDGTLEISGLDDRPEKIDALSLTIASQTQSIGIDGEILDLDKSNEEKKNIEKMYKELEQQNAELAERLKNMDCSLNCLKSEGEKEAACLKDALEKAKKEAHLASRSRDLAMDLAKQSRDQTDVIKASRDAIADEVNAVKCNNTKLQCECEQLRCKLKEIKRKEDKKCTDVDDKVCRIKSTAKQKEMALETTVCELRNEVKMQRKRICDLTLICTKQRDLLRENENCISTKIAQLTEAENKIQSVNCKCRQMQEQIDNLQCRLNEEMGERENLERQLDERQDSCNCEIQIKNKIIEDQIETIKKLKTLLQDSERMAHEAACEFESLRDELHCLKQTNKSLRMALDEAEEETTDENDSCDRCNILETEIRTLEEQKHKAVLAAKFAAAELCKITAEYERKIDCEKQRNAFVNEIVQRQQVEIQLLRKEILCVKEFRSRRSNVCIDRQ
ncbi:myosin-10-like isoform X2 [Venturia canescens]|uniref:myosin-10-like isoform X2 n=1 Tax=Venturia canescens TaxID=32260 RepID=UPI001C9C0AF2|nr:myosin-10-like isoform X2 [Venturia canescens]XP_043268759.1 myosin-10-like isoform X2 [Venturia canescens]